MIKALDEQCALPNGSDAAFLANLDKALATNDRYASRQTGELIPFMLLIPPSTPTPSVLQP
jgi:myosin heavy subunit